MSGITVQTATRVSRKLTRIYHELAEIRVLLNDSQSPEYCRACGCRVCREQRCLHDAQDAVASALSPVDLARQDLLELFWIVHESKSDVHPLHDAGTAR